MSKEFKPMKFGCGRYVQAPGAVEIVGREAAMLKSRKALIVGGKQALDAVGTKMEASLNEAGVEPYFYTMTSDCTYETLDYLQNTLIPQQKVDLVIGSGGGKGATFAHALYYACKAKYTEETSEWLHGEIVGLGCQASMYAYERGEYETKNFARFMKAIGQPMSLKDLGLDTSDKGIKKLVDCMMVVWGKRPEAHWPIIYNALQQIKE